MKNNNTQGEETKGGDQGPETKHTHKKRGGGGKACISTQTLVEISGASSGEESRTVNRLGRKQAKPEGEGSKLLGRGEPKK